MNKKPEALIIPRLRVLATRLEATATLARFCCWGRKRTGENTILHYNANMATLAQLEHDVLQLPEDQRVALVHRVLEGSDSSGGSEVEALWNDEIVRRLDLLDKGQTKRIPISEVFRELDQKLA